MKKRKTILIVGGGFGGVRCALELARKTRASDCRIILLSDKPHFEYTPSLYKVATGRSPLEVCIPLREIFNRTKVDVCVETVTEVRTSEKQVFGASGLRYSYDFLVLGLGSETDFLGIPGIEQAALKFKTLTDALRLNWHMADLFEKVRSYSPLDQTVPAAQIVVIGGGYTGIELAGAIAVHARDKLRRFGFDSSLIRVNIVEASSRIMPSLPHRVSRSIVCRLNRLGVIITTDRPIKAEDVESSDFFRGAVAEKTLVFTAGTCINKVYKRIEGLVFDKRGRVVVDRFLRARGLRDVFVIGDAAAVRWSGMAQTALYDGRYTARVIAASLSRRRKNAYRPAKPASITPVGHGWAAAVFSRVIVYGFLGFFVRELADLRFFLSILPASRAISVWRSARKVDINNNDNSYTYMDTMKKAQWVLRIAVAGEFIGHGVFALGVKAGWIKYFTALGLSSGFAESALPIIGVIDIAVALLVLIKPVRIALLWMALWGFWTALLRPIGGDPIWDFVERFANWGAPLALLVLIGFPKKLKEWFQ
ncbi:MAG: FAD-dependent oxidoreductase [Candidatus Jacksonbacteria bacterium]|nr:FAD-dependent oxidoreductase [Candidatus Jacksonbacteria bacterium]